MYVLVKHRSKEELGEPHPDHQTFVFWSVGMGRGVQTI